MGALARLRSTLSLLARLLARLLAFGVARLVSRPRCAACAAALTARTIFCRTCALTVTWPEPTDGPGSAALYGGAVRTAILRLKYEGRVEVAAPLAHLLVGRLDDLVDREVPIDGVVPVPLHPTRLAERGFNQCALVGAIVANHLGVPHLPRALRRDRATATQASLGRAERMENVRRAFSARTRLAGKRVLLVDDVTTTGSTLEAAREALFDAGAREVIAVAIAAQP